MNDKLPTCEISLRAIQKDIEYIETTGLKIFEFCDNLNNFVRITINSSLVDILSKLIFYIISYKLNKSNTTPGEEYTYIKKNQTILLYILFKSIKSWVSKKIIEKFELFSEDILSDLEYAIFFITGKYSDIFELLFNTFNLKFNNDELPIFDKSSFQLIGILILIKQFIQLYQYLKTYFNKRKEEINTKNMIINFKLKNHININEDHKCLLCLDTRKNTSVTICGHLFCWECIIKYLQTKPNCPFCRKECLPQNVIFLQNYK